MNIKEIKTKQFAGIRKREVALDQGLNIIVGNNETGKSTLAELIYEMLFRDSDINMKDDKDFYTRFMPSDGIGDVVDGTIVFTTTDDEYILHKKWGKNSSCEIEDRNGNISEDENKIRKIISRELVYRKGLYDDVVFASQKRQTNVVEHILKNRDKNAGEKQDIVSIIAKESMTSSGEILPGDIEEKIQKKIKVLSDNWDFSTDGPKNRRGIDNPWKKEVGRILQAYYELKTLEQQQEKCESAENAIDVANKKITESKEEKEKYNLEKTEYGSYTGVISSYKVNRELKEKLEQESKRLNGFLQSYPSLLENYKEATCLINLKMAKDIIRCYRRIDAAKKKFTDADSELKEKTEVCPTDVTDLENITNEINDLKAKLSNINLVASLKQLGNTEISVRSLVTGELIDISNGEFDIHETLEITIPGIMSMMITAKDVDVKDITEKLKEYDKEKERILKKYNIQNLEKLKRLADEYGKLLYDFQKAQEEYNQVKADIDISTLENEYLNAVKYEPELESLDERISKLCGEESVDDFQKRLEYKKKEIEEEFGTEDTIAKIKDKYDEEELKLNNIADPEKQYEEIPEKYRNIENSQDYFKELDDKIHAADEQMEIAERERSEAEKQLGEFSTEELIDKIDLAQKELEKYKDEYERWNHILNVLRTTRDNMRNDSALNDVKEKFAAYLSVITDGRISLDSMDENMDVTIHSGNNLLSYEILSEGTKDTIALAFRLAMLEHLFPNGGGLVVLDDPFTEMDENRTKQACKLVQKFADAGNQVIFVTCDNKYKNLLSGNVIEM